MPFSVIWMDLEIMILNEVSQTETNIHHHLYVKSKKKKELIYKTEKYLQT